MRCHLLALLVAIAAAPAIAKEPALGFYVGAGAGVSSFRGDYASQVDQAYAGTGFTVDAATVTDDRDTAWKVYAGWRFHPYGAIEAAWLDFGEARTHYAIGVPNIGAATRDGRYRLSGAEVSALGIVPLGDRATVYAKAGALFSQLKYDESGLNQFGEPGSFSHTNRETKFLWGLGKLRAGRFARGAHRMAARRGHRRAIRADRQRQRPLRARRHGDDRAAVALPLT